MSGRFSEYYKYIQTQVPLASVFERLGIAVGGRGNQPTALCPFHADTHPSLHLYENNYHCFACGAHGDIFSIIEKKQTCDFRGAVAWLEANFPILLKEKPSLKKGPAPITHISPFEQARACFAANSKADKDALAAFAALRHFKPGDLEAAEIYFTDGGKLSDFADKDRSVTAEFCAANLIIQNTITHGKEREAASFRDAFCTPRVVFTLRDLAHQIKGFAGRACEEFDRPKYLFTRGLPKSKLLYQLDYVHRHCISDESNAKKQSQKKPCTLYLVEGLFDALRLQQQELNAAAVLGSQVTNNQISVLEQFVQARRDAGRAVALRLFLDSDAAGIEGVFRSIKAIWKSSLLRQCVLTVTVNTDCFALGYSGAEKDPDLIFIDKSCEETEAWLQSHTWHALEFLMSYFSGSEQPLYESAQMREYYQTKMAPLDRIQLLNNVAGLFSDGAWNDILEINRMYPNESEESFAISEFRRFFYNESSLDKGSGAAASISLSSAQQYELALQIAKTSHQREEVPLDMATWDRIQYTGDVIYPYLNSVHRYSEERHACGHIKEPMLAFNMPKDEEKNRLKSLPIHENLLLQQHLMNELLSDDVFPAYARLIPAVRYSPTIPGEIYTTGCGFSEFFQGAPARAVSFAYQVNMPVINGSKIAENGMFRPFYDCWRSLITFLQEGIDKIDSERIFRVKLDIKGYYESITRASVRDAFVAPLAQALASGLNKFTNWNLPDDKQTCAHVITDYILEELFGQQFINPETGAVTDPASALRGIPQGPNLSAYVANVLLFRLDKEVATYVDATNKDCPPDTIKVRYGRYVDDMVIVSDDYDVLLEIEHIILRNLQELHLELSPKTEDASAVIREDAQAWLFDEKGGLGTSGADIIPEDSLESFLNDSFNDYSVDRRSALKILNSGAEILKTSGDGCFEDALSAFFKTESVRYGDITRLAEFMLRSILLRPNVDFSEPHDLYVMYETLWDRGLSECPDAPSMLKRRDVVPLSFLDGITRVLTRRVSPSMGDKERERELGIQEKMLTHLAAGGVSSKVIDVIGSNLLSKNSSLVNLKILQVYEAALRRQNSASASGLTKCCLDFINVNLKVMLPNTTAIFFARWMYALNVFIDLPQTRPIVQQIPKSDRGWMETFHFYATKILKCTSLESYEDIASSFNEYAAKESADPLLDCMKLWFPHTTPIDGKEDTAPPAVEERAYSALRVLCNLLNKSCLAEILGRNKTFRICLFNGAYGQVYLPIPPAVNYPGIFAIDYPKNSIASVTFPNRNGVLSSAIEPPHDWVEEQSAECLWQRRSLTFRGEWSAIANKFECTKKDGRWTDDTIKLAVFLFQKITSLIQAEKNADLILSKHHLFLDDANELHALSYHVGLDGIPAGVAISSGSSALKWKTVEECGKKYSIASAILNDTIALNSCSPTSEDYGVSEILSYALPRLSTERVGEYAGIRSEHSIEQTVKKTLTALSSFADAAEDDKPLYLLELYLTDILMSLRIRGDRHPLCPGEETKLLCRLAENAFSMQYTRIATAFKADTVPNNVLPVPCRRVPALWLRLGSLLESRKTADTTRLVCSAFFIRAISVTLQTQVLERVWALSEGELELLSEHDLPLDFLSANETVLLLDFTGDVQEKLKALMKDHRAMRSSWQLEKITPMGWLALLGWVLEIQSSSVFCTLFRLSGVGQAAEWAELETGLNTIGNCLLVPEVGPTDFPYDGISQHCKYWSLKKAEELLTILHHVDRISNFSVEMLTSPLFGIKSLDVRKNTGVAMTLATATTNHYPANCLTFVGVKDKFIQYEQINGESVWTQTSYMGRALSVSAISGVAAEIFCAADRPKENALTPQPEVPSGSASMAQLPSLPPQPEKMVECLEAVAALPADGTPLNTGIDVPAPADTTFEGLVNALYAKQKVNWAERQNITSTDRIALFQFDVDDSYVHPISEVCLKKNTHLPRGVLADEEMCAATHSKLSAVKEDPTLWTPKLCEQYGPVLYSCAERRRHILLTKVLEVCQIFGVEILLLPEYSVRPETVEWMAELIEQRQYQVSVWAGTCRLPVGRHYRESHYRKTFATFNEDSSYDYAAVLPILCNAYREGSKDDRKLELILSRIKKYPALSLQEVINPTQQRALDSVMKTSCAGVFFGDARDDVTELICAETFLASNPSNVAAFAKTYGDLSQRFNGKFQRQEDLNTITLQDLMSIGKRTSLMQMKRHYSQKEKSYQGNGKYGRTPIILTPAYTSRAVDYYVSGQAAYLASGLTTVFCNAAGMKTIGGSCFIGAECWDNHNAKPDAYLPNYALYHGVFPGVYRQSNSETTHGALGKSEQALVICDVNPMALNAKPTPESMQQPLALIAHLPIVESCLYKERAGYNLCRCERENCRNEGARQALEKISGIIRDSTIKSTADDETPDRTYDALNVLGKATKSPGLEHRAEFYLRQHRDNPQVFPPPTLLDWIWVEMDYTMKDSTVEIDVPAFSNAGSPISHNKTM